MNIVKHKYKHNLLIQKLTLFALFKTYLNLFKENIIKIFDIITLIIFI
jgi:hypothetical protein